MHSVRSTNVYEERSLGIYQDDISFDEEGVRLSGNRMTVWGNYLAMHARKQLAFGMRLSLDKFILCNSSLSYRYVVAWPGPLPGLHNRGWQQSFSLLVASDYRDLA